jgi:hypothetical protein
MDWVDAVDYKDVAYQHEHTRWTRRTLPGTFAKVRVAGSNPVVRSKNSQSVSRLANSAELQPEDNSFRYRPQM